MKAKMPNMSQSLKIERTFQLASSPEEVWRSLVNPSLLRQYHHSCSVAHLSPGESGDDLQYTAVFRPGDILEYVEHSSVKFSTFDSRAGLPDAPQNYLHITYQLAPLGAGVELTVIIENFMIDEHRFEHSKQGWENVVAPRLRNVFTTQDN